MHDTTEKFCVKTFQVQKTHNVGEKKFLIN